MRRTRCPTSFCRPTCQPSLVSPCSLVCCTISEYPTDGALAAAKGKVGKRALLRTSRRIAPCPPAAARWARFALPTLIVVSDYQADAALPTVSGLDSGSAGAGLRLGSVSSHLMMEVWSAP